MKVLAISAAAILVLTLLVRKRMASVQKEPAIVFEHIGSPAVGNPLGRKREGL